MSRQQQILSFATKRGRFYNVKGRGLIKGNNLSQKFKMMMLEPKGTLGAGAPARKKVMDEAVGGGSVRHHNRPYQLKDMEQPKKSTSSFKPIEFKL